MHEPNFLSAIYERKKLRLAEAIAARPFEDVRAAAVERRHDAEPHAFSRALGVAGRANVIAEFKRASPSKGLIRADLSPGDAARLYERGGAAALSVLTEGDDFKGSLDDLTEVKSHSRLTVIRKDFIFDEYQIYESAAAGADSLLLIAAMLEDEALARLRRLTEEVIGMDALVEVHTADEMRRAEDAGATLVGVNNRDLQTFDVSLDTSFSLAAHAPAGCLLVSESGIRCGDDIARLREAGYKAFLVGETLMRAEDPCEELRLLTGARAV